MDWGSFIGPAVVAAGVSGIISVVGLIVSTRTAREKLASDRDQAAQKLAFDERLAERKFDFDKELAERKFRYDRDLHEHKRRVELAEEVLADFYRAREILRDVRWSYRVSAPDYEEGTSRKIADHESDDEAIYRNHVFAAIERLKPSSEFFGQLRARRYRFMALFGDAAGRPFEEIHKARIQIVITANELIEKYQPSDVETESNKELRRKQELIIYRPETGGDEFGERVDQIVAELERICRPEIEK